MITSLTDAERDKLSKDNAAQNRRSENNARGKGGGQ